MERLFSHMIVGGILIFVDIWVGFDLLPDAFGWMLIATSFSAKVQQFSGAKQAKVLATVLAIVNLPFTIQDIALYVDTHMPTIIVYVGHLAVGILIVVFYYYFFLVAKQIAVLYGLEAVNGTKWMTYFLVGTQFILIWIQIVSPHIVQHGLEMVGTLFLVIILLVYISFVGYLVKMYERCKKQPPEMNT
ncbi:hypothetical protein AAGS61_09230 [Lysinibacillus sp. KU-BSD001]|uniref:hypothetical protein n=1 Tax=Lysinibacillus sp. KU-BSD001 TaxID=3141328 RepID=UPI0036E58DBF